MKRLIISSLSLLLLLTACEMLVPLTDGKPVSGGELVVEGWIDEGGCPVVSVTTTLIRPDEPREVRDLLGLLVRDAEVVVSDGGTSCTLKGRFTNDFFPPYVYTGDGIVGEAGRTYTLTVRHGEMTATAATTIPPKTELDGLEVIETEDGVQRIYAEFTAVPGRCYGFFSKGSEDEYGYTPVFLGFINGSRTSGPQTVSITRGSGLTSLKDYKPGYESGETVSVRFCTMDYETWHFWEVFEQLTGVSYIMTYPTSFENLPSNVEGAYGYWAGYGTVTREVTLPGEKEE